MWNRKKSLECLERVILSKFISISVNSENEQNVLCGDCVELICR